MPTDDDKVYVPKMADETLFILAPKKDNCDRKFQLYLDFLIIYIKYIAKGRKVSVVSATGDTIDDIGSYKIAEGICSKIHAFWHCSPYFNKSEDNSHYSEAYKKAKEDSWTEDGGILVVIVNEHFFAHLTSLYLLLMLDIVKTIYPQDEMSIWSVDNVHKNVEPISATNYKKFVTENQLKL